MVDEGQNDFKSSWNNASGLTIQIDSALTSANKFFMDGDYGNAFNSLCAVVMRFTQHLTPEEEKELDKIEQEASLAIRIWQVLVSADRVDGKIQVEARKKYKLFNNYIMRLLNIKGLLLQGKRDSTQMKW